MTDDIIVVVEPQPVFTDVFAGGAQFTGGGTGTVTSVGLSMPSGFSVGGSPITHSGTFAVTTALSGVVHASGGGFTAGPVNLASEVTGTLAIANGGTGQITANAALNALLPAQSASAFLRSDGVNTSFATLVSADIPNISAALITTGILPVARGGTGAGVANSALNNLLPAQIGNAGKALVTNGTDASWTAIAGGTVTSVDVSGANGILVSGNPITSAGTIALDLGNITPLSVAASGTVTGFNLSGTNTGDVTLAGENYLTIAGQVITAHPVNLSGSNITGILASTSFPALSGDVSTLAGSVVTTIGTGAVTYAKIQNVTSARILGRYTAGSGVLQEISLGSGLSLSVGGVLSAAGSGGTVTSVDVSVANGLSVSGNPITTSGTLALGISANGVAYDRLAQAGANTLLGNNTGLSASVTALSVAQTKTMLSLDLVENTALSTWAGSGNVTTLGTITTGAWNGTIIGPTYGGTGVNNGAKTITLGGNFSTSGANALTLTTTGPTTVTLPTAGTLVNSAVTTLSSLAQIGTISVGVWQGTPVGIAYGGSGQTTANDALNAFLPSQVGNSGKFLQTNGSNTSWATVAGSGTVTSVDLAVPAELTVSGNPITVAGTITLAWATETTNKVFAAPNGSTGVPTFRALVAADIPNLDAAKITTGTLAVARGGTNIGSYTTGDILYASAPTTLSKLGIGASGYVLTVAGGVPTWQPPTPLLYITEALNVAAPNATINTVSLTVTGGSTNADFALVPKGTGALLAQVPDNASTGGNKRGTNAVDLQTVRASAASVASGTTSVVSGGDDNTASGTSSFVGGGHGNTASNTEAAIAGGNLNVASGVTSTVGGGDSNTASAVDSTVGGGNSNIASGTHSTVSGGDTNTASGNYSGVLGGASNTASQTAAAVSGGQLNQAAGANSAIPGGYDNGTTADSTTAIGREALAANYGQIAHAAGFFAARGDAQSAEYVLRNSTGGNALTSLFLDGSSLKISMPTNGAFVVHCLIVGKVTGNLGPAVGGWELIALAYDNGGSTSVVGSTLRTLNTPAGWGTPGVGGGAGIVDITVTGAVATNIDWVARVQTAEITF